MGRTDHGRVFLCFADLELVERGGDLVTNLACFRLKSRGCENNDNTAKRSTQRITSGNTKSNVTNPVANEPFVSFVGKSGARWWVGVEVFFLQFSKL